ncbi:MAG: S8 family serine peptidase, partial [Clostridia bacterium]|nr:S8 family serine peptidase [Clostridia bacterium]
MFCSSCGAKLVDGAKFCGQCGAKTAEISFPQTVEKVKPPVAEAPAAEIPQEPIAPPVTAAQPKPQVASEPKKVEVPKQKKGGKKKGVIALLAVAVLLLAVLITAVAVVMQMFPVEVTITDPEETKTTTGRFVDLSFDIEANQSIRGVSYALDPADENNTELYTKIESVTNQKKQTVTIEELKVPVGDSTLYLYVQTAFGESFHEVDLEFDFGYLAAPDPDAIVTMDDGSEIVNVELLVVLNKSLSEKKAENLFAEYGGEIIGQVYALNQYQVSFADTDVYALEDIRSDLSQNELVSSVCFNGVIGHDVAVYPDDSGYDDWNTDYPAGNNWALECIDAPGAWEYNSQMSTVKVGVVDSVLDYDHPDLKVNPQNSTYLATNDFKTLEELMDYYDEVTADHECNWWNALWGTTCTLCEMKNHGTHVAGIIGATANNGLGTSGVNWNAELCFGNWWYYTIPENGERLEKYSTFAGSTYQIARLVMSGCRVVNVSIGAAEATDRVDNEDDMSAYFENIVSHMEENGYDFLITKAAGNADYDASNCYLNRVFTAGESARAHTLIVAAVENHEFLGVFSDDWRYSVADYSNYGELVDIAAPGTDVYSTVMDGYESMPG